MVSVENFFKTYDKIPDMEGKSFNFSTDLLQTIFSNLDFSELAAPVLVCKRWHYTANRGEKFMKGQFLGRLIFYEHIGNEKNPTYIDMKSFANDPKTLFKSLKVITKDCLIAQPPDLLHKLQHMIESICKEDKGFHRFRNIRLNNNFEERGFRDSFYPITISIFERMQTNNLLLDTRLLSFSTVSVIFRASVNFIHIEQLSLSFFESKITRYRLSEFNTILSNAQYIKELKILNFNSGFEEGLIDILEGISYMPALKEISTSFYRHEIPFTPIFFEKLVKYLVARLNNNLPSIKTLRFPISNLQCLLNLLKEYPEEITVHPLLETGYERIDLHSSNPKIKVVNEY